MQEQITRPTRMQCVKILTPVFGVMVSAFLQLQLVLFTRLLELQLLLPPLSWLICETFMKIKVKTPFNSGFFHTKNIRSVLILNLFKNQEFYYCLHIFQFFP